MHECKQRIEHVARRTRASGSTLGMPALRVFLSRTVRSVGTLRCWVLAAIEIVGSVYEEISMDVVCDGK